MSSTQESPNDLQMAQEFAADLYEKKMTVADLAGLTERERELIDRATRFPTEKVLESFVNNNATRLDQIKMPRIVRWRCYEILDKQKHTYH